MTLGAVDFTNVVSLGAIVTAVLVAVGTVVAWRAAKNPVTLEQYTKLAEAQGERLDFLEAEVGRLTGENGSLREANAGLTARVDELAKLNSVERILDAYTDAARSHEAAANARHHELITMLERIGTPQSAK